MKRLLIVDFLALFHRSRAALRSTGKAFTTSDGIPVTGVFPFLNNLLACVKQYEPTHVVIANDAGGGARKQESSSYKANRPKKSEDFYTEANILRNELLDALGLEVVGMVGFEADDVIHTINHAANYGSERMDEVIIWTCDQDLLQCATEKTKVLLFNSAKKQTLMGPAEVEEKWGCGPDMVGVVKAIAGDASDNIKGVPGVGIKTAVKLLTNANWDLDIIFGLEKYAEHTELIKENLQLVRLRTIPQITGAINWEDWSLGKGYAGSYAELIDRYEFKSLTKRLGSTIQLMKLQA